MADSRWIVVIAILLVEGALVAWWLNSREESGPPTVSGRVLDADGNPVVAGVWRLPWLTHELAPWVTDEQGHFVVPLADGRFRMCALGPAPWAESESVEIDGSEHKSVENVVLRLRRPARVTGKVVDEAGMPVANLLVMCISGSLVANDSEPTTQTDEAGRFSFDHCDPGKAGIAGQPFFLDEGQTTEVLIRWTADKER